MKSSHVIIALALCVSRSASSYDTETHALITSAAYSNWSLTNSAILSILGINRLSPNAPFNKYWVTGVLPKVPYYLSGGKDSDSGDVRYPEGFEACEMQEFISPTSQFGAYFAGDVNYHQNYSGTSDDTLPIKNWLVRGAIREDDVGWFSGFAKPGPTHCLADFLVSTQEVLPRSLNHFYDPYSNIELTPAAGGPSSKAIDWALGYVDSQAYPPQRISGLAKHNFYSYEDARDFYWAALTGENLHQAGQPYTSDLRRMDSERRMSDWASTFRALGNVMHLLEDMGQPQHTRNDAHSTFNSPDQQAFEDYTNDRVLGTTDEANPYALSFFSSQPPRFSVPPLGTYPVVSFSTPLRFFTTRQANGADSQLGRAGLADYTNRGFFTGGTLPYLTSEPLPPPLSTDYGLVVGNCDLDLFDAVPRLQTIQCSHFTHSVPDFIAPQYSDIIPGNFVAPALVSDSIFREIIQDYAPSGSELEGYHDTERFALGITELNTIGNLTIPRAVGYASGLLTYFFRGVLTVTAPSDGVVSVLDHGVRHHAEDGYPVVDNSNFSVFGFTSIRLNVINNTLDILESGLLRPVFQTLGGSGAKLVAVARFHRNPCYQSDLSGDILYNPSGNVIPDGCDSVPFTTDLIRTSYPETVVSSPIDVSGGIPTHDITFHFDDDPIPVNATDLFVQVAYRGPIGEEIDGIAVGSLDLAEPTYSTFVNAWKYNNYSAFDPRSDWEYTDTDSTTWYGINTVTFCVDKTPVYRFHRGDTPQVGGGLLPDQFLRVALLMDQQPHSRRVYSNFPNKNAFVAGPVLPDDPVLSYQLGVTAPVGQADDENSGDYLYPVRTQFLGMPAGDYPINYQAWFVSLEPDETPTVLHPATPSIGLYSATPPLLLPSSGKYLPETDGKTMFDAGFTDAELWCARDVPSS